MRRASEIIVHSNLVEYFKVLVTDAMRNQKLDTHEFAEFYLVNLLSDFHKSERMRKRDAQTGEDEPMAITFLRAVNTSQAAKVALLKDLGDRTLYLAGIFSEHLESTAVGLDYYLSMGGNAYTLVADMVGTVKSDLKELYAELSGKFPAFVDILAEVSVSAGLQNDRDLLKLYERWLKTGSSRAAKVLAEAGIPLQHKESVTPQ